MDALLAPVAWDAFRRDTLGQRPLHIKAPSIADGAEKAAAVLDWAGFSRLLQQSRLWSSETLNLVLDKRKLAPEEYCRPDVTRDGAAAMMADIGRVQALVGRGASLVLNDAQTLAPGIRAVADALAAGPGGRIQANIYCSRPGRQGFAAHFDKHDVYAVHVAGVKRWRLYGRHFVDPVNHPKFSSLGDAFHAANKGELTQEVTLEPGDLLYLPRGWYHEALAQEGDALHVAFSVTPMVGLDALEAVFEAVVDDPAFRASLDPLADGDRTALARRLGGLGDRIAAVFRTPELAEAVAREIGEHRRTVPEMWLPPGAEAEAPAVDAAPSPSSSSSPPPSPSPPPARRYRVANPDLAIRRTGQGWVLTDGRKGLTVPAGLERKVAWVLEHGSFAEEELAAAFPEEDAASLARLIQDLTRMRVVTPG